MDKMREEFEAWISHYIGESWLKPDPARSGEYFDNGAQSMWESWQASRAALCVELPSFENGCIRGYSGDCEEARMVVDAIAESLDEAGVRYE